MLEDQNALKSKYQSLANRYNQLNLSNQIFNIFKWDLNIVLVMLFLSFIAHSIEAKQIVGPSPKVIYNATLLVILVTYIAASYYYFFSKPVTIEEHINLQKFNRDALNYYNNTLSLYDNIWKVIRRIHNLTSIFSITLFWYLLQYQNLDKDLVNINEFLSFRERKHIACIILIIINTLIPLSKKYLNQLFEALKHTFKRKFLTEFEPFLDQEKYIQKPNERDENIRERNNHIKGLIIEAYIGFSALTSYGFFLFMVYEALKKSIENSHNTTRGQLILMPIIMLLVVTPSIVWERIYKD